MTAQISMNPPGRPLRGGLLVDLVPPLDLAASLEPYRRWGDDLIDRWDGERLLRTIRVGNRHVAVRATIGGSSARPQLAVTVDDAGAPADAVRSAVAAGFVAAPASFPALLAADPALADLDRRYPGLRPVLQCDLFTALVRSISAQQVNLTWAATTRRRLAEAFGTRHALGDEPVYSLDPARLAAVSAVEIRALQFTTAKAEAIVGVARAMASRRIDEDRLAGLPDDEVIAALVALRGIGLWSAEWILSRTFGRPRVVAGDLGVRKAVAQIYLGQPIAGEAEVREATRHWGESANVAQTLVLRSLLPATSNEIPRLEG